MIAPSSLYCTYFCRGDKTALHRAHSLDMLYFSEVYHILPKVKCDTFVSIGSKIFTYL